MPLKDGSEWVGRVIEHKYRVLTCIGSGASARVYRAEVIRDSEELPKGSLVALKISRPHVLGKQRDAARFLREVQAINRIDHRCCVDIFDWGITGDSAYIAMELLEEDDLYDVIRRHAPFSQTRSVAVAIEIAGALAAAHKEGVVHRDLKPRNIVMLQDGEGGVVEPRIKVLDFGLAKLFRHGVDEEETVPDALTKPGSVLGTPHYMAPEQVSVDGEIDGRADVYAASVILYEMLTATRPYRAKNAVRLLVLRGTADPDPPSRHRPDLDPELERIVLEGLAREADDRFASAEAFQHALAEVFPRIAEEEDDMSLGNIPPPSFDSDHGHRGGVHSSGPSVSSMPPDTIEDERTAHDEQEAPTRLMDRPDLPEEEEEEKDEEQDEEDEIATRMSARRAPTLDRDAEGIEGDPSGDETASNEAAGDEAAGDEAAGDEAAGDEAAGDEAAGDEAAGDEAAGDEAAGDEAAGDEAAAVAGGEDGDGAGPSPKPRPKLDGQSTFYYAVTVIALAAAIARLLGLW